MHFNPEKKNQLKNDAFKFFKRMNLCTRNLYEKCEWKQKCEKTKEHDAPISVRPSCKESCFHKFSPACRYHVYNIRITITKQISSVLCRKLMRSSDGSKRFAYLLTFFKSKFICMHLWMIYIEIRSACIIQKPAYFTDNSGSHSTLLHFLFSSFSVYQSFFSLLCLFFVVFTLPFTVFLTHVM